MTVIHTFSDGFGAGHAFPMWPQIIEASGFKVINYSQVSISVFELINLFYNSYNSNDYFIIQLPESGRIPGIRMPCKVDKNLVMRDEELIDNLKNNKKPNMHICTVNEMDRWSKTFADRGNLVQPQPIIHARWLKKYFPQYTSNSICKKIENYGYWEPFYWDREQEWKNLIS